MKHLIIFLTAALISLSAFSQETNEQELSAEAKAELQEDLLQLQKEQQEDLQQLQAEQQEEVQQLQAEQQQLQKELQQQQKERQELIEEKRREMQKIAEEIREEAQKMAEEKRKEMEEKRREMEKERGEKKKDNSTFNHEVYDSKTYNFSLGKNPALEIDNKFGNIIVSEWDKPELQMVVERKVTSRESREYAEKRLSCIKIEVKQEGSTVKAKTNIDCEGSSRNSSLDIIYTVFAPKETAYELEQKFGNIILKNSISGSVKAEVSHGNFTAEILEKPANVDAKFGDINITKAQNLNLASKHGKAKVASAKQLNIRTAFSNASLGSVDTLTGEAKHGNYKLDRTAGMSMKFEFTNVSIKHLEHALNLAVKHGNLNVEKIDSHFSNIKVNNEFGNIQLGMSAAPSVAYRIQTEFGDIDMPASWSEKISKQIKDHNKREMQGAVGSGASKLEIRAKHGNVKIK